MAQIRVAYDDQIFAKQERGGISKYFVELMGGLRQQPDLDVDVVQPWTWTKNLHALEAGIGREVRPSFLRRTRLIQLANRTRHRSDVADLVHHTRYDRRYLDRTHGSKYRVVTVYDMIPEIFPDMFPAGNPHGDKAAVTAEADLLIFISKSAKSDFCNLLGRPTCPMIVIPLGVDPRYSARVVLGGEQVPDDYVLFVGNRRAYKDFDVLLETLRILDTRHRPRLLAVGGGYFTNAEQVKIDRLGLRDCVSQITVTDLELPAVYAKARAFVFPSRYEGFGLPTLEAMASGCPVILARASAHPEVGGSGALYFDPGDADDLARVLEALLTDESLRQTMIARGRARAAEFSWSRTARETGRAYHKLTGTAGWQTLS